MYLYYNPVLSTPIYDNRNVQIEFLPLEEKVGRKKRGEEIIGYKIGCVSKDTQKKMGFQ